MLGIDDGSADGLDVDVLLGALLGSNDGATDGILLAMAVGVVLE